MPLAALRTFAWSRVREAFARMVPDLSAKGLTGAQGRRRYVTTSTCETTHARVIGGLGGDTLALQEETEAPGAPRAGVGAPDHSVACGVFTPTVGRIACPQKIS